MNIFITAGAILGLLAIIIGAFGAHGLENSLSEHALARYHTGVEYQFYHVGVLLLVGILLNQTHSIPPSKQIPTSLLTLSGWFFIMGIILFSGSLYGYALTGNKIFGMITPIGGLSFIIGWLFLLLFTLKSNK